MTVWAAVIWAVGLLTAVPYATYYVVFEANREHYAMLITWLLFWIFGYWGVVGPVLVVVKTRRVFRAIGRAATSEDLRSALASPDAREVAIDFIASENHVPRFIAARVYELLVARLPASTAAQAAQAPPGQGFR